MALTIEDGTIVAGADSYATVAEARAYALSRGVTLSATDSVVEILLRKGSDFIESLEDRFKGDRTDPAQPLAWPRAGVILFNATDEAPDDEIPELLKRAQIQLAMDAVDIDLQPTGSGREIIKTKVDVIETEYAKRGSGSILPELNKAMAILQPLLNGGGSFSISTVRV